MSANRLADALLEAMEEAAEGIDLQPIVESVLDEMRNGGEFVTDDVLSDSVEEHVENYMQNNDYMERYQVEEYISDELDSHLSDTYHYSFEEIQIMVQEFIEQRTLRVRLASLWTRFWFALTVRRF